MTLRTALKRWLGPIVRRAGPTPRQLSTAHWGLRRAATGELCLGTHELAALATRYGTPVHVIDAAALRANLEALAGVEVFYSYKTNPLPAILSQLHDMGAGAEVISELELDLALRLGVPPERIVYNGPAKSDRSLRTAIDRRILLLNVNHRAELPRIAQIARECGCRARIGIRVSTRDGWSWQFGTPIVGGAALALFEEALSTPEVELVGLHSHRGALLDNEADLAGFIAELLGLADQLHARLGWSPQILDLGGSLAIATVRSLSRRDIGLSQRFGVELGGPDPAVRLMPAAYSATIRARIAAHYRNAGMPAPRVIVEPGRAVTGSAQFLLTRVVTTQVAGDGSALAVLDAGINLAGILRHERHQIFKVDAPAAAPLQRYRLVGPICQPGDVLVQAVWLPALASGDVLAIMDSGAYFESDSTVFSFARPGTVLVDGPDMGWARRPETLDDVIARDVIPVRTTQAARAPARQASR